MKLIVLIAASLAVVSAQEAPKLVDITGKRDIVKLAAGPKTSGVILSCGDYFALREVGPEHKQFEGQIFVIFVATVRINGVETFFVHNIMRNKIDVHIEDGGKPTIELGTNGKTVLPIIRVSEEEYLKSQPCLPPTKKKGGEKEETGSRRKA